MNVSQNIMARFTSIQSPAAAQCHLLALTLSLLLGVATSWAQSCGELVLHSFNPGVYDGASPYGSLIQGQDGALYGMTWGGGSKASGTVFRMNADGTGYSVLYSFTNSPDGSAPDSGLAQGRDGVLYGTTYYGGANHAGTVFKLNTNGTGYVVLYSFTNSPDGAYPYAGLLQGRDGALYGTTYGGGASNLGTVFRINTDGSGYSRLHDFGNSPDGSTPFAGLVQGEDGMLYGTTSAGGVSLLGTVFAINTNGSGYSILHHFAGFSGDGGAPKAGVIQGADGALYGTTVMSGTAGDGTVFKVNTDGSGFMLLHSFTNSPDGSNPYGGLVQGGDGALYGTTTWGGKTNAGTLFRLNTDGSDYAVLYDFDLVSEAADGSHSYAGLTGGGNGVFYGSTLSGGSHGFGTVFQVVLAPNLAIAISAQGGPEVTLTGFPGQVCHLQASADFSQWVTVATLELTNGMGQFIDPAASILMRRFYRAAVP